MKRHTSSTTSMALVKYFRDYSQFHKSKSTTEAVSRSCSIRKALSKILQNSQENICAGVSLIIKFGNTSGLQFYWKGNPNTGVFLWILRNFYITLLVVASANTFACKVRIYSTLAILTLTSYSCMQIQINLLKANVSILYPLKTPKNLMFSGF